MISWEQCIFCDSTKNEKSLKIITGINNKKEFLELLRVKRIKASKTVRGTTKLGERLTSTVARVDLEQKINVVQWLKYQWWSA